MGLANLHASDLLSADSAQEQAGKVVSREVERRFEGSSNERSFEKALADALAKMDKFVAEEGDSPCTPVSWRVVETGGRSGTPAGLNVMHVAITATYAVRKPNPVGTWRVTRNTSGVAIAGFQLAIKREKDKLTGTVTWPGGKIETAPVDLKVDDLTIRLKPANVIHQYSGKLSGDTIKGNWAAGIGVFEWEAKRESDGK
jgi:hypothetical protein